MRPAEPIEKCRPLCARDVAYVHDAASAWFAGRLRRCRLQQLTHFVVCCLAEVVVPLTDGRKMFWRSRAHDLVGDRGELATGLRRTHRYRNDDAGGAECPYRLDRRLHRRPGGQTVVDEHD